MKAWSGWYLFVVLPEARRICHQCLRRAWMPGGRRPSMSSSNEVHPEYEGASSSPPNTTFRSRRALSQFSSLKKKLDSGNWYSSKTSWITALLRILKLQNCKRARRDNLTSSAPSITMAAKGEYLKCWCKLTFCSFIPMLRLSIIFQHLDSL